MENGSTSNQLSGLSELLDCHVALIEMPEVIEQLLRTEKKMDVRDASSTSGQVLLLSKALLTTVEGRRGSKLLSAVLRRGETTSVDENELLELTGSPLQCSFNLDDDDGLNEHGQNLKGLFNTDLRSDPIRLRYQPLSAEQARSALSTCTMEAINVKWPRIVALCSQDNDQNLLYLALFTSWNRDNRPIVETITLHSSGPWKRNNNRVLAIKNLVEKHLTNTRHVNKERVESEASCSFVFDQGDDETENDRDNDHEDGDNNECENNDQTIPKNNKLTWHLSWPRPTSSLELPPTEAQTKLMATIVLGSELCATALMFDELKSVMRFQRGLKNEGLTWRPRDNNDEDLETQVERLMSQVRDESIRTRFLKKTPSTSISLSRIGKIDYKNLGDDSTSASIVGDEDDTKGDFCMVEKRFDLDFLDRLYVVLSKAQSYNELMRCFQLAFTTIQQEQLRPFIFPDSSALVADLIATLQNSNNNVQILEGSMPLQMLVQLGIEKIKRDIAFTFTTGYHLSKDQLRILMTIHPESSKEGSTEDTICHLCLLLAIIELASLVRTYASPPNELMANLIVVTFEKYRQKFKKEEPKNGHVFEFDLDLGSRWPKDQLCKSMPSSWQLRLTSSDYNLRTVSVVQFTDTAPVPHPLNSSKLNGTAIPEEEDSNNNNTNGDASPLVYCTHLHALARTL